MGKKRIIILSAAVIITAAAFFAFNYRASTPSVYEKTVYIKTIDYLALETDEVVRIKKLRISGFYKEAEPEIPALVIVPAEKQAVPVKKPEPVKITEKAEPEKVEEIVPEIKPVPVDDSPSIAVVQPTDVDESDVEIIEEEPEEKPDIFTEKELFSVETPKDRGFYRKKVFVAGKTLDTELTEFSWRIKDGENNKIETDYAGEFGFYIPTADLTDCLKIYITASKNDGNTHEKLLVLFNRNVKPEVIIEKPYRNYKFGKYLTVSGIVNIKGHEKYIKELVKETGISISPAGYEGSMDISRSGRFKHVIDTSLLNIRNEQKLLVNASLHNYKNSSSTIEISKSKYSLVDYEITAGNRSISLQWEDIPVKAEYKIRLKREGGESEIIKNIKSPVLLNSLSNHNIYNIQIEAEETENSIVLTGKNEKVLPLDPAAIKPESKGFFGRIKVKWQQIRGASRFNLFRESLRSGENKELLNSFSGISFTDENVTPAEKYSYSIEPDGLISVRSLKTLSAPSTGADRKIHEINDIPETDKIRNVFMINNYAYSITDKKIIISDISDIDNPVYSGEINGSADYLAVDEEYCYTVSAEKGFVLYNISDPSDPVQIVKREQYKGRYIWVSFPFVFISEEGKGIRALNLENPSMPSKAALYSGYSFSDIPVITRNKQSFLTSYKNDGTVKIYKVSDSGKLSGKYEFETENSIIKAQSTYIKDNIISAVLTEDKEIILFNISNSDQENLKSNKHIIKSSDIKDYDFFTAHSGRSYLAVDKIASTDLYSVDTDAEPSFFTSVPKKADENISLCHDNSGYAYMVKSADHLEMYRIMTEGVSYINNRYSFPDKIHDFKITDKKITALTESGIYFSEKEKYYPEPVLLSGGQYRKFWNNNYYTAAVNKDYNYEIFIEGEKDTVSVDNNGIRGNKAVSAGNYSVILNENKEILVFSYDISKNAPHLLDSIRKERVSDIAAFTDGDISYTAVVIDEIIEIYRITDNGLVKILDLETGKTDKIRSEIIDNIVFLNIYSENEIKTFEFKNETVKQFSQIDIGNNSINLYKSMIVESEGENGISIYKYIDGRKTLVSRCADIFSFDNKYSDGKIYSKSFNSIDEVIPVIPNWIK